MSYGESSRTKMKVAVNEFQPYNRRKSDRFSLLRFWLWCFAGLLLAALLVFGMDKLFGYFR